MFKDHPKGLMVLFFTEMWERFSYYGMRGILILYMVASIRDGGFGMDDTTAAAVYGLYTAMAYLLALPGGWFADRIIGQREAVFYGGALIAVVDILIIYIYNCVKQLQRSLQDDIAIITPCTSVVK